MASESEAYRVQHFMIAWIAANQAERSLVEFILDEKLPPPQDFCRAHGDQNEYSWGRMGVHCVVVAFLPGDVSDGTATGAITRGLAVSLPQIRASVFVGASVATPGEAFQPSLFWTFVSFIGQVLILLSMIAEAYESPEHITWTLILVGVVMFVPASIWSTVCSVSRIILWWRLRRACRAGKIYILRPGDVVVAVPSNGNSGLVRYNPASDMLKVKNDVPTSIDYLAPPPKALLDAMHKSFTSRHADAPATKVSEMETPPTSVPSTVRFTGIVTSPVRLDTPADCRLFGKWYDQNHLTAPCLDYEMAQVDNAFPCFVVRAITKDPESKSERTLDGYYLPQSIAMVWVKSIITDHLGTADLHNTLTLGEILKARTN